MKLLLDTHLLVWAADNSTRLRRTARDLLNDEGNVLFFSAVSIWEVAIKRGLKQDGFGIEPRVLRRGLLDNGYVELAFTSDHALAVESLPPVHKDPFDRALVAQALGEGVILLTADRMLEGYAGVRRV